MNKPPTDFPRSNRGFTLTELLVVVSIIGVLIALLVPAISTMRAKGKSTFVLTNLHSIGGACASYVVDHGGCYPAMCYKSYKSPYWTEELTLYMSPPVYGRYRTYEGGGPYVSPQFVDPFVKDGNHHTLGDYGCNQELFDTPEVAPNGGGPLLSSPRSMAVVTQPSRVIAVFAAESGSTDNPMGSWYANSYIIALSPTVPSWSNRPAFRDGKNIDTLFADGHTEVLSKTYFNQEKKNLLLLDPSQW